MSHETSSPNVIKPSPNRDGHFYEGNQNKLLSTYRERERDRLYASHSLSSSLLFLKMENLHHLNLHIHLLSLHKKTHHKLNILRSTHLTCIYKNYTLHLKDPPKNINLLPPPLDIFPKAQSPLLFSQNSASSKTERALFHTLTLCLSYSRDAAVPAVPAKTIKPFDPHCNWPVPRLHPDTATVAR